MDYSKMCILVVMILCISVTRNEGRKEILSVDLQEGEISTGHFTIPQKVIEQEIYKRTNLGKVCDADIRKQILDEDVEWTISIVVGNVRNAPRDPEVDPQLYVAMKMYSEEVSLDLAFFTTKVLEQDPSIFVVDNITWSDGVITVKRGQDYLVMITKMDEDCGQDLKGTQSKNVTMSSLESWYPHELHICDDGNGWPQSVCEHVTRNLCELRRADNDICFRNIHEGYSCRMSMEIVSMTGVFREKSLITAETPLKSVTGYHFNGLRIMDIIFPCLYDGAN